jgi:single-stranded DNA-specific DHH superfamily exonuclease
VLTFFELIGLKVVASGDSLKLAEAQRKLANFLNDASVSSYSLVFHCDPDGFASGVINAKALTHFYRVRPQGIFSIPYPKIESVAKMIARSKTELVCVSDLSLDAWQSALKLLSDKHLVVIDHHKHYGELKGQHALLIKPQLFSDPEPSSYPASKLCYDVMGVLGGIGHADWLACLGIIGDMAVNRWADFVRGVCDKYGCEQSLLEMITEGLNALYVIDSSKLESYFWRFFEAKMPQDVPVDGLMDFKKKLDRELEREFAELEQQAHYYEDLELVWYELDTRVNIKSIVANTLAKRWPSRTIVVVQRAGDHVRVSARRGDMRLAVNELLERAVEGLPKAHAGGHVPAAAGSLPAKELATFKQRILNMLKERYVKR